MLNVRVFFLSQRRAVMILLQVATPYMLDWLLARLQRTLESDTSGRLSEESREVMISHIPAVRHLIAVLHRCHLALFYVRGVFYHIAKRIAGTHYVSIHYLTAVHIYIKPLRQYWYY